MTKVKVLIDGYVKKDGTKVVPTTTLIEDGKAKIIVDSGMGKDKVKALYKALQKKGLSFEHITTVFITHYHPDHTQYVACFSKAKLIDWLYIYDGDSWLDHQGEGYKLSPNVSVIHTSGHTPEHASLKVKTKKGIIVVAGDVWWHSDLTPKIDPMAQDQKKLEKSRKKILKIADFIIPGHGKMFRNPRKIRK